MRKTNLSVHTFDLAKERAMKTSIVATVILLFVCSGPSSIGAATSVWDGSTNLFPEQVTPPWGLNDTASPENPVLLGGILTLSTDSFGEFMAYGQGGAQIAMPNLLEIEAVARFVSGSSAVANRTGMGITFVTEQGMTTSVGHELYIGPDLIFLVSGSGQIGQSAVVDTDGSFHTYRIVVNGTALGSSISVFYDTALTLSGTTSVFLAPFSVQISWGDITGGALGVSEWKKVSHNAAAAAIPEPGTLLLLGSGLAGFSAMASRRHRGTQRNERNRLGQTVKTLRYVICWIMATCILFAATPVLATPINVLTLDETRVGTVTNVNGSINFNFASGGGFATVRSGLFNASNF